MINYQNVVEWEQWGYVDGKLFSITKRNCLLTLLNDYLLHLESMSFHYFFDMWMSHQFNCLLDNIIIRLAVFVNDFAQNILLWFQKEPSSVHWIHEQVTLHPSIAYFMCPGCGKVIIKEEIFHITSDLRHDWKAVEYFMQLNMKHLASKGVRIDRIHDFTDNAVGQYRSRFIWDHLSNSSIPWSRHYFAPSHGKGPSDWASGFFKSFIRDNILSQNVVLKNIDTLYKFAVANIENQPKSANVCLHETHRKIFFSKEINHITRNYPNALAPVVRGGAGKKKFIHSVRSTGTPGIIQIRSVDCCCHDCIRMSGPCKVKHTDPWITAVVESGVDVTEMTKSHWDNFKIRPGMDPRQKYPIMENTKLKKWRDIQDINCENEDDVPLANLRRKLQREENRTENIPLIASKEEEIEKKVNDVPSAKRKSSWGEDREAVARTQKIVGEIGNKKKMHPTANKMQAVSVTENIQLMATKDEIGKKRNEVPSLVKRKSSCGSDREAITQTQKIVEKFENKREILPTAKKMYAACVTENGMPSLKRLKTRSENTTTTTWQDKHQIISQPKCYRLLEVEIQKITVSAIDLTLLVNFHLSGDEVDRIALSFLPEDAPEGLIPIICGSDENCFCRAISRLVYGDESHYMEIRVRIVIEAVRRKPLYLNDTFLNLGQSGAATRRSRSQMYSIYSQSYNARKTVEEIYDEEVLTIC